MRTVWLALLISLVGAASVSEKAFAANKKAKKMVSEMAEVRDALLKKHPAIVLIDNAVRSDCSEKRKGAKPEGEFCSCASAVTIALWMSGTDPRMIDRFNGFLQQPSESAALDFQAYQGPELYAPLCSMAI